MDFWAQQADARRRSRGLIALFIAAVAATVAGVDLIVIALLEFFDTERLGLTEFGWAAVHPRAVALTTLIVLALITLASLHKTATLRGGGGVVARSLGGLRVPVDTQDPQRRRLLNVVEEMAIASGVPVPAVYVLEQEEGINAFTAGHSAADAAIAVTRGALENLSRTELQGVVAHEFSHMLNGDMRLNIRLMGLLFGLLLIAVVGRTVWWNTPRRLSWRRSDGIGVIVAMGVAIMSVGYIGVFFGRLIQAAISRQREALADASAVQFARDPAGLRDALIKIGSTRGSRLHHPRVEEVAHMLLAPGTTRWFATHPPLVDRIRALDPSFDPRRFGNLRLEVKAQPLGVVEVVRGDLPDVLRDPDRPQGASVKLEPHAVAGLIGNPGHPQFARAEALQRIMPPASPDDPATPQAAAVLLALVLDPKPAIRALQLQKVREHLGDAAALSVQQQSARLAELPAEQRLPMIGRIAPALRQLPRDTRRNILECLNTLILVDGRIEVFEYALTVVARVYLEDALDPATRPRPVKLSQVTVELQTMFAALAEHGHADAGTAQRAYEQGMRYVMPERSLPYRPVPGWAAALDRALRCLDRLPPPDKASVVRGLTATVALDGMVTVSEAELLRAICASLHCPLPPLVPGHAAAG